MGMKRIALPTMVRQVDVERRQLVILGTTPTKDRYGDIVEPKGADLRAFRRNPVFLWAHNYSQPPIGKSINEKIGDEGIEYTIQFADTEFAKEIFGLYRDGFLNAASIGFIPLEYEPVSSDSYGYRYTKWEQLELSGVPVPANPDALALAVKRGMSQDMIQRVIEPQEKGVISYARAHPDGTPKAAEDAEWDAGKEVREADGQKALLTMCAWYDSAASDEDGDSLPDAKSAYKLPHHQAAGEHAVVWKGVSAAMAALLGARGGVDVPDGDRKGIYNHLVKHYQEFEKEPPDFKAVDEIVEEYAAGVPRQAFVPEQRAGAVLAKRNKDRLNQAKTLIDEVLADAESSSNEDHTPNPTTKAAPEAASSLPTAPVTAASPAQPAIEPNAIAAYAIQVAQAEIRRLTGKVH